MPDYIYLFENRLSPAQQNALKQVRDVARESGMTVFLTGGAVRDLTSGSPVRDLDFSVQGNALQLKKNLKEAGGVFWGEHHPSQTLFFRFPGGVRAEISSARREDYPKPGKVVYQPASILEDLRRRDFTANAMALSLNEGSYGLLMDPMNGAADLETRSLRLVSNYGFLEDPVRLIRAVRFATRLGWELEEKTKTRFENAQEEGVIDQISPYQQGYEVEEIVHEEDGLRILKALEAGGWMKYLFPAWTSSKADLEQLEQMRELLIQLQMQGVNPDFSAAQAKLLTARLSPKDLAALKAMFVRKGFVHDWETLDDRAREFGKHLTGKEAATPSGSWKLFTTSDQEAILWLGLTTKSAPIKAKYNDFFNVWPEARQRIPYALMQEMRITPELEGYQELLRSIFLQLIDGKLTTEEEMRAFLEPHSPPAPPPPVTIRRPRGRKARFKEVEEELPRPSEEEEDEDGMGVGEDDEESGSRADLITHDVEEVPALPPAQPKAAPEPQEGKKAPAPIPSKTKPAEKKPDQTAKPEPPSQKAADKPAPKKAPEPAATKAASKPGKKPAKAPAKKEAGKAAKPAAAAKTATKSKPPAKKAPAKKASVASPAKAKLRNTISKPQPKPRKSGGKKSKPTAKTKKR